MEYLMLVDERVNVNDWITYVHVCTHVCAWVCVCKANKLASDEGVIHHTRSYAKLKKDVSEGKKETEGGRKVESGKKAFWV